MKLTDKRFWMKEIYKGNTLRCVAALYGPDIPKKFASPRFL